MPAPGVLAVCCRCRGRSGVGLAIDLGTGRLKVGLVSLAGMVAWATSAELTTTLSEGRGAEQDPVCWWRLITDAARAGIGSGTV